MKSVIFGLQWGDEGKGKVTTYFSKDYDYVVRYSGGSNAGHTVEYSNFKIVHHLFPSVYVGKEVGAIISNGVVLDLEALLLEIEEFKKRIGNFPKLFISDLAHVVLPYHKKLDEKLERIKGKNAVGTTKRGIGPAYADKVHRIGLRLCDFEDKENFNKKIKNISDIYSKLYDINVAVEEIEKVLNAYNRLKEYIVPHGKIMDIISRKDILFESTQGVLLDIDVGTYPYVTGSNCNTTGIQNGIGFPVNVENYIGVFKAYLTRVGNGPFPTEAFGEEGEMIRKRGNEFGATTGRPRRCGWLDLPLLKYAIKVSNATELIMTKSDILNGLKEIKVCVAYEVNGKIIKDIDSINVLNNAKPIYETLPGWSNHLSKEFKKYISFIEDYVERKITYISIGPKVEEIVKL